MCTKNTLNRIMNKTTIKAREVFGTALQSVILYGSYAREDFDDDSDIDVMILADISQNQITDYEQLLSDFALNMDLEYNIVLSLMVQDKATFDRWKNTSAFFKAILNEGVDYAA